MRRATLIGSLLLAIPASSGGPFGASPAAGQPPETPGHVELITISPGEAAASRFGHTAIRVRSSRTGTDLAWSFGQSSVDDGSAVSLLVQGRLRDRLRRLDPETMVAGYVEAGRTVHVQTLRLDADQAEELAATLDAAIGHTGAYGVISTNCTTRIRDALDRVLSGRVRADTDTLQSAWTPRQRVAGYTAGDPALHIVVHTLLGPRTDRPSTVWESMFLPATLRDGIRTVEVSSADGRPRPLVVGERRLAAGRAGDPGPRRAGSPLWILLGSIAAVLLAIPARRSRRAFAIVGGAWALGLGVAGLGLLLLGMSTADPYLSGNANAWIANPLLLVGAVLMWGGHPRPRLAAPLFSAVLLGGLGAVVLTLVGAPTGVATSLAGLLLPGHAVLAVACWNERRSTVDSTGAIVS